MELFQIMTDIANAIDTSGKAMSTNLVTDNFSTRISIICLGIEIVWLIVGVVLDGDWEDGVAMGIRAVIVAMIAMALILNWPLVVNDITKTSAAVVQKIGNNQELGAIVATSLDKALQNTKIDQVYASQSATGGDQQKNGNWFSVLTGTVGQIFDEVLAGLIELFNGGVVGIVAAISIFIILLGKIVLWIGLAFGPLCIAFSPWKPARKIAESWASFMFASMMFPAVAAAVLVLSGGIFDALAATAQKAGAQALPSTVYSIASLALALVAGMVMLQVPKITQALFGNGLGVESPHLPKPQQKKQN